MEPRSYEPLRELVIRTWLTLALIAAFPTVTFLLWLLVITAKLWNKV